MTRDIIRAVDLKAGIEPPLSEQQESEIKRSQDNQKNLEAKMAADAKEE